MKIGTPMKQLGHQSGVYSIFNLVNGKRYVGYSVDLGGRCKGHRKALIRGKHDNSRLQRAWNKYGENGFVFEVTQFHSNHDELPELEQNWVDHYDSYHNGYNLTPGGDISPASCSEVAAKISRTKTGRIYDAEYRAAISLGLTGRKLSTEHKAAISSGGRGKKRSPEACANICAALRSPQARLNQSLAQRRPEVRAKKSRALSGRKLSLAHIELLTVASHTPEANAKRSITLCGRELTPEACANHLAAMRSPEVRRKISESLFGRKGRTFSVEHRAKLAEAKRGDRSPMRRPEVVAKKVLNTPKTYKKTKRSNSIQLGVFA